MKYEIEVSEVQFGWGTYGCLFVTITLAIVAGIILFYLALIFGLPAIVRLREAGAFGPVL